MLSVSPGWEWVGYGVYTPASAEDLTTPDTGIGVTTALGLGANTAVITPSGNGLFFTADGSTTPSATAGGLMPSGVTRAVVNQRTTLKNMKWVQQGATTTVYVEWYQAPGG